MSRVFIAYNTKPIMDTTKTLISAKLFLDPFKTSNKEEETVDYKDLARYYTV